MKKALLVLISIGAVSFGQSRGHVGEYALILHDPPVAQSTHSRAELSGFVALQQRQRLIAAQRVVISELQRRKVAVEWAGQLLGNVVYVRTTPETAMQLGILPGVAHVVYCPPIKPALNTAVNLMNIPQAQTAMGGAANAGAGIKIGILDSGIDQTHAGFQDKSLTPPAGFPMGDGNFTNSKVIVARSFIPTIAQEFDSPDDYSPRDHMGHGTAVAMIAAGVQNVGPLATIQGVAPKAFLGNYKIFGSPGINDYSSDAAVQQALEQALNDGMDIVTLAISYPISVGPLDSGASCFNNAGIPCDPPVAAIENAIANGMVVVVAAGNDGNVGIQPATLQSIDSPGTAPSAITVGASTNSHSLYQSVRGAGGGSLPAIRALFGDGPHVGIPVTGPLVDVTTLGNDGLACSGLSAGSLAGSIALVQRGTCTYSAKINNAQSAGAIGVVIYQSNGVDTIYSSLGAQNTGIPAVMIGNTDGNSLKSYLASHSGTIVALDPEFNFAGNQPNVVAPYSSRGPSIGTFAVTPTFVIKPELVATGDGIYTATQNYDPNADTFDVTRYTGVSGTSYAVPFVAGAAALVKQKNRGFTPAQIKSALVNTASQNDIADEGGTPARVDSVGAGKLKADDALNAAATLEPATICFGPITAATVSNNINLKITNVSGAAATFNFAVQQRDPDSQASVTVTPSSLQLAAGASSTVVVSLKGNRPNPGSYEGSIAVTAAGPTLHVPYQYLVGSGVANDIYQIFGGFIDAPGATDRIGFRLIDKYGAPVLQTPAAFTVKSGGGSISVGDPNTGGLGQAGARVTLGSQLGDQVFTGSAGGLSTDFFATARPYPNVSNNGVVNAASNQVGGGLAPGSYISIYGTYLADTVAQFSTPFLPVSLSYGFVSFDGGGVSLPAPVQFVSPGQINVQIPWEFQGQTSAQLRVWTSYLFSAAYTVPLATYSPGVFATVDSQTGAVNSANRGDTILVFCNGLGPVSNQPASGAAALGAPQLSQTPVLPTVTVGGTSTQVLFSGLAPGYVGLYQVNATIPSNAPTGNLDLVVSIGGVSSTAFKIAVQ